ncbi:hypothetical protein RH915_03580 [Serpentinicella sp. ANB-PHB4]|nr:hypothetical protein [Serpentinicella sp. ANB-PHB4]MDR5658564.1 hypothetical protein [Serpentinicella sp. ANB-PHB4]
MRKWFKYFSIMFIFVAMRHLISSINQGIGFIFGVVGLGIILYLWDGKKL